MGLRPKIKQWLSIKRLWALSLLSAMVVIRISGISFAAESITSSVAQSYTADTKLQRGIIVIIDEQNADKVVPAKLEEIEKVHGIVVDSNDAPVTLSNEGQQVFVATTGRYQILVSDENGGINVGDYITLSSLQGVGMKGDEQRNELVFGKSLEAFDSSKEVLSTAKIGDREVHLGRVMVDITVAKNPLLKGVEPNIPSFLKRATEVIAGKPVDALRAYIGLAVFILTTIISGSLIYGGVRSALISIGRNPLSKKSIVRSLFQIVLVSLIILISGIFGVYLILRL